MIIVTGAAGFIGSCMITKLNAHDFNNVVAVDLFDDAAKNRNLAGKSITQKINRNEFFVWLEQNHTEVEFIFHLGARTDTVEVNKVVFEQLNTSYSKEIWGKCVAYQIPLIYASSAATYGLGEHGYSDNLHPPKLTPLNAYGESKNKFDIWALEQREQPFFWVGLKFFNVYGPNEYHKKRMASVVFHAFNQINQTDGMKLFRSHNSQYKDGEQMRDFIYVEDVLNVMFWFMHHRKNSGIYNVGSGQASTFLDLTKSVFSALGKHEKISFIDTPSDIRDKYQYFTKADMSKIQSIGYSHGFTPLDQGVNRYISKYLVSNQYY